MQPGGWELEHTAPGVLQEFLFFSTSQEYDKHDFWHSFEPAADSANYEDWAIPQRSKYQRKIEALVNGKSNPRGSIWVVLEDKRITKILWYTLNLMSSPSHIPTQYNLFFLRITHVSLY